MLRVQTKKHYIKILQDVALLCEASMYKDDASLIVVLQEVQDAIIEIGGQIEKDIEASAEIISLMEHLCETFYLLSKNLDRREVFVKQIKIAIEQIIGLVSELKTCYQVVFFPYKAEMWDSLESIWLACKEDERCDCKVVPIPYYSFDANKDRWIYHYEIERFPSYVPVVHYLDYDLMECPDAAFIHNPYDEYNYVTHVASDYYSYNLKLYVKKLFYVPYYVSGGDVSKGKAALSAFKHADYLMLQSEVFKEGMKEYEHYNKAVVVGSPKFDRVIRLCREGVQIPEEWKYILKGKKSLMLNTSIHQFLHDGEAYLKKLYYLFKTVKQRHDVVIIWRPHPLLQSTIESMLPGLLDRYLELQRYFENEDVGILDMTPDVDQTVAITDGYIGEMASSVTNLFALVGKPLFILNNYITESVRIEEKQSMYLSDCEKFGDDYYCTSIDNSRVYAVQSQNWDCMIEKAVVENVPKWLGATWKTARDRDTIYLAPRVSKSFFAFNMTTSKVEQIYSIQDKTSLNYRFVAVYKNRVFYLPSITKCIVEYDILSGAWKEHYEPISALQKNIVSKIFEDTYGYFVKDNFIWATNLYSNRVLCFDMECGEYQIFALGDEEARYAAIAITKNNLCLSDTYTGKIHVWNLKQMQPVNMFSMPKDWRMVRTVDGRAVAHDKLIIAENYLIAVPRYSNALVRIDLRTGEVDLLAGEFWEDVLIPTNNYKAEAHAVITFAKMVDEDTLLIQKRRDASLLELNVRTWEYQVHHPKLVEGEFEKLLEGEDGFEKINTNMVFARRESRYFSFEDFLDDLVNERFDDAMERQKEAMKTIAVNLDGTCGEKIHEFMMDVLLDKTIKYKR